MRFVIILACAICLGLVQPGEFPALFPESTPSMESQTVSLEVIREPGAAGEASRAYFAKGDFLTLIGSFYGEATVDAYAVLMLSDGTYLSVEPADTLVKEGTEGAEYGRDPKNPTRDDLPRPIGKVSDPGLIKPFKSSWKMERGRFVILRYIVPDDWPTGPAAFYFGLTKPGEKPFQPTPPIALTRADLTLNTPFDPSSGDFDRMVLIPGGTFYYGQDGVIQPFYPQEGVYEKIDEDKPDGRKKDDTVQKTVPTFYLDQYEVTNAMYAKFLTATQSEANWVPLMEVKRELKDGKYLYTPTYTREAFPIRHVTHADARAYAAWAGKRLPTEVEWEYVASGAERRTYPWGETAPSKSHGFIPNAADAHQVWWYDGGRTPDNHVYGLAGNVFEWCVETEQVVLYERDRQDPTKILRTVEFAGGVVRGGSYTGDTYYWETKTHYYADLAERYADVGFRCAKDFTPQY